MQALRYLFLISLFSSIAMSQTYYLTLNQGVTDEFNMSAPNGKTILQGPKNDTLSASQTIPFAWKFYGTSVTKYRASDNGYITFDELTTISSPDNTALPNASAPNNAIYAFWDNLELSNNPSFITNDIKTYTVGTAPNRIHVIQWHVTPRGKLANGNYLFFALRLYEAGDFDILLQQIRLDSGTMTGTLGCENENGSAGTMASGSPTMTYKGGVYIKENVPVYTFTFGAQRALDALMKSITLPEIVAVNKSYSIGGTVVNHGTTTITSLDVAYQVESTPIQRASIGGLDVKANANATFTHPTPWQPTNAGSFAAVKVWIERINGSNDEQPSDDTLTTKAFVTLGLSAPKKVLIEEYSTAPCGYCPDGAIVIEGIRSRNPNILTMTHHSGYLTDAMTVNESVTIADAFANGAPTANIDRILWPGTIRVAIGRNEWEQRALEAARIPSPVTMQVNTSFEPATRLLSIICNGEFIDYAYPAAMRLNVFIVEDNVTGTGSGYDQTNYYNDTPGHPLYHKGDPIIGYVHRHVLRAVPTGTWGDATGLQQNATPGMKFTRSYTYTVPASFKEKDISVIAFLAFRDGERNTILNAAEQPKIISTIGRNPIPSELQIALSPNPTSGNVAVRLTLDRSTDVRLQVFDVLGRMVMMQDVGRRSAGEHEFQMDMSALPTGVYLLTTMTNTRTTLARLQVIH